VLGGAIIAIGLAAEIKIQFAASRVETTLRNDNHRIVALLNGDSEKLRDKNIELEKKYARVAEIGQVFESEALMRGGLRSGLDVLTKLTMGTTDPEVAQIAKQSLQRATEDFKNRMARDLQTRSDNPLSLLRDCHVGPARLQPRIETLSDVVREINGDELYCVAAAFETFNWMPALSHSGTVIKMFDFNGVNAWCSRNKPKCEAD
jgi:hypothetical protein